MVRVGIEAIVKPSNDDREYKRVLLSNGLQVLLVSDTDTDKAAAAMDVHVGSFSDPDGLQGLAHFLEHMLFYASEKYPKEGMYKKFLNEHGGYANAYTGHEHTNYHFEVNASHLEEALDRFAQFFISPLLSHEATSREIHAVDSENSKNLLSDSWRLCQLQKHFSSKDHPYHKYETGNKTTLHSNPHARGIDVREELLRFYEKYYSAGLMALTVYGKETVSELEALVRERFSPIVKNNSIEVPRFSGQPCFPEHLKIMVKSVPVRDQNVLVVTWPVTPSIRKYKRGASQYVQHFWENEAEGSLIALLKKLGWANSLSASEEGNLDYAFFTIYMELTDAGHEQVQDVLDFLFQYVRLLQEQGVVAWIFEEKRAMNATWFNFKDKTDPMEYAVTLSDSMQNYPVQDWLATDALFSDFDMHTICALANQLQPQRVRIFCSSKSYEMGATDMEPWYSTPYSAERIDDLSIKRWEETEIDARLFLPSPNLFLPIDFSIKNLEETGHPVMLRKTDLSKLWYKSGMHIKTPKAYVYLSFHCPESNKTPESTILTYIFTWLLADEMTEYAYYTGQAGLYYSASASKDGLEVVVAGYHDKLMSLTAKIVEKIVNFQMKEDRFAFVKEKVVKNYANMRFMQPHGQAHYEINHILSDGAWHLTECLEALPFIDAPAFAAFFPRLLSRMFVEALVGGNVTKREAIGLLESVEDTLSVGSSLVHKIRAPSLSQLPERKIMCLEAGSEWLYPTAGFNPDDENSAIGIFFQAERDCSRSNVLLELFTSAAKEQHFNQLRTVEQLGYFVDLYEKHYENIRGVQITIQSTIKDPTQLDQRTEEFFLLFERELQMMSDEEFKNHVDILLDAKMEKYKNLWEESDFYWREINGRSLQFDRRDIEVAALKEVKKEDLVAFFNRKIRRNGCERKKLSVHVFGNQHHRQLAVAKGEAPLAPPNALLSTPIATMDSPEWSSKVPDKCDILGNFLQPENNNNVNNNNSNNSNSNINNQSVMAMEMPRRIDNVQVFKSSQSFYCSPTVAWLSEASPARELCSSVCLPVCLSSPR